MEDLTLSKLSDDPLTRDFLCLLQTVDRKYYKIELFYFDSLREHILCMSRLSSSILSSKIDMWWNPTGTKPFLSFIKSPNIIIRNFQKTSQEIQNVLRWIGEEKSNKIKLKWFCIMYFCWMIGFMILYWRSSLRI